MAYTPEQWKKAQDLIIERPDIPYDKVAEATGIPKEVLYSKATNTGWATLRNLNDNIKVTKRISEIIKDIASNVTDVHEHTYAMMEALQNSYRIEIVRDDEDHLHYQNMIPWPSMPADYKSKDEQEQRILQLSIEIDKLQSFLADMITVIELRSKNMEFITKMLKGSLPKIDPYTIDLTRRSGSDVDVIATVSSKNLLKAAGIKQIGAKND